MKDWQTTVQQLKDARQYLLRCGLKVCSGRKRSKSSPFTCHSDKCTNCTLAKLASNGCSGCLLGFVFSSELTRNSGSFCQFPPVLSLRLCTFMKLVHKARGWAQTFRCRGHVWITSLDFVCSRVLVRTVWGKLTASLEETSQITTTVTEQL